MGTYDAGSNTLFVSDLKLTGLYENAYPNSNAPSTVTVMGAELNVLPSAIPDLAQFKVGDRMTLLLTTTGQVAGAVSTDVAKSNAVGVAKVTAGGEGLRRHGGDHPAGRPDHPQGAHHRLGGSSTAVWSPCPPAGGTTCP